MSGSGDASALLRSPWLLGIAAIVVGVVLALALGAAGFLGAPAAADASPTAPAITSAPSPSLVAVGSAAPTPGSSPGATPARAPTAAPTAAPTPPPTRKPARTSEPAPTADTNPTIRAFDVPKVVDCTSDSGSTLGISWRIANATGVRLSIDGGLYRSYPGTSGSDNVPFGCDPSVRTHTYTLRTTGGTGPADEVTRSVKWGAPKIVLFRMGPGAVASCPDTSSIVGIDLRYEIKFATGAKLHRDGELYATYSSKVVDTSGIVYECSEPQQVFTLTTTGGYGSSDSEDVVVTRQLP